MTQNAAPVVTIKALNAVQMPVAAFFAYGYFYFGQ
jgi:hypothetical protein